MLTQVKPQAQVQARPTVHTTYTHTAKQGDFFRVPGYPIAQVLDVQETLTKVTYLVRIGSDTDTFVVDKPETEEVPQTVEPAVKAPVVIFNTNKTGQVKYQGATYLFMVRSLFDESPRFKFGADVPLKVRQAAENAFPAHYESIVCGEFVSADRSERPVPRVSTAGLAELSPYR